MNDEQREPGAEAETETRQGRGSEPGPLKPVERLFPFVVKSRGLIVGRDALWRSRSKLQFVLVTTDLSDNSRAQILRDFAPYPILQHYVEADLQKHFGVRGGKVVGFAKSTLATSIYAEMKAYRLNKPPLNPAKNQKPEAQRTSELVSP